MPIRPDCSQVRERIGTTFRPDANPLPELNASATVHVSESDQAIVRAELA